MGLGDVKLLVVVLGFFWVGRAVLFSVFGERFLGFRGTLVDYGWETE